jgi:hypothetical protein
MTYVNSPVVTTTCNQEYPLYILPLVFLLLPPEDLKEDPIWNNLAWMGG